MFSRASSRFEPLHEKANKVVVRRAQTYFQWGCLAGQGSPPVRRPVVSVESSSLLLHGVEIWFMCLPWWFIDELEGYRVRGLSCEPNNQLNVLYHFRNWGWGWACKIDLSPPVIHYWPFQGGSSVVVLCCLFLVSEFLWCFALCMFLLFLVRFGLLSGHLLGTSCSLGWPYVLCILIICNLSCFQLWFEGWIWILIVSVPGLCILFTFTPALPSAQSNESLRSARTG